MALKKSMCEFVKEIEILLPFYDNDGEPMLNEEGKHLASSHKEQIVIPQLDLDMHEVEEAEIRAHWAIHDSEITRPVKLTAEEEIEMFLAGDAELVKQKREEWKKANDEFEKKHQEVIKAHRQAADRWEAWTQSEEGIKHHKDSHGKHVQDHIQRRVDEINVKINEEVQRRKSAAQERKAVKAENDRRQEELLSLMARNNAERDQANTDKIAAEEQRQSVVRAIRDAKIRANADREAELILNMNIEEEKRVVAEKIRREQEVAEHQETILQISKEQEDIRAFNEERKRLFEEAKKAKAEEIARVAILTEQQIQEIAKKKAELEKEKAENAAKEGNI